VNSAARTFEGMACEAPTLYPKHELPHLALYELQQSVIYTKTIPLELVTSLLVESHFSGNQFAEGEMKMDHCVWCFWQMRNVMLVETE